MSAKPPTNTTCTSSMQSSATGAAVMRVSVAPWRIPTLKPSFLTVRIAFYLIFFRHKQAARWVLQSSARAWRWLPAPTSTKARGKSFILWTRRPSARWMPGSVFCSITEWFGLEGTLRIIFFQTPHRIPKAPSNPTLSTHCFFGKPQSKRISPTPNPASPHL